MRVATDDDTRRRRHARCRASAAMRALMRGARVRVPRVVCACADVVRVQTMLMMCSVRVVTLMSPNIHASYRQDCSSRYRLILRDLFFTIRRLRVAILCQYGFVACAIRMFHTGQMPKAGFVFALKYGARAACVCACRQMYDAMIAKIRAAACCAARRW